MSEIKVDKSYLAECEGRLSSLASDVASRRLDIQFSEAKGEVPDKLIEVANQLNEVSSSLASLIQKTKTAVTNTRVQFTEADNSLAKWWGSNG